MLQPKRHRRTTSATFGDGPQGRFRMTQKSDRIRVGGRLSLSMIAGVLDHLNEIVDEKIVTTEQELEESFAKIEKHVNQIRAEARTAQDELKRLIEEEKFEPSEVVAEWKATRLTSKLHGRAD